MKLIKRTYYLIFILFFIHFGKIYSQNDVQISQYMYNKMYFNPAYTGDDNFINASVLMRQQWVGFENAPSTQMLNVDNYIERVGGVGLSVINDKLGYEKTINVRVLYAYHKYFNDESKISIGAGVGFINTSLDGSKLIYEDKTITDPNGLYNVKNSFAPTVDLGLKYSSKQLSVGLSVTHINVTNNDATLSSTPQTFYLFGNYNIQLTDKIQMIPSFLVKSTLFITDYEVNTNFVFSERFYGGLTYRNNEAFVILLGLNITENIKIRYSYDFNMGPIYKTGSTGSHEIMLSASLYKNKKMFKSPRFF